MAIRGIVFALATAVSSCRDARPQPAAAAPPPKGRSEVTSIVILEPQRDTGAASQLAGVVAHPLDPALRRKLSESYAAVGYRAMADFFSETATAIGGTAPRLELAAQHPQWGCRETAPLPEVGRITAALNSGAYAEAKRVADEALRAHPASCPVLVQHALAVVAAAVMGGGDDSIEVERAFRTLLTADVEMNYLPYDIAPEWPYQLLASYFAAHGDIPSAYESALLAQRHLKQRPPGDATPAATEQIETMVTNLRKMMPRQLAP